MGYIIFLVVATVLGYRAYTVIMKEHVKDYLDKTNLSDKERRAKEKEAALDNYKVIAYLIVWLLTAGFSFYGNILGIILAVILTGAAMFYIFKELNDRPSRRRAQTLYCLALPFLSLVCLWLIRISILLGVIITVVLVAAILLWRKGAPKVRKWFIDLTKDDEE